MIMLATPCSSLAIVFGASGIVVPSQRGAKTTAVGAIAHILADFGDVLGCVRIRGADPDDCALIWAIGSLPNGYLAREAESIGKACQQADEMAEEAHDRHKFSDRAHSKEETLNVGGTAF